MDLLYTNGLRNKYVNLKVTSQQIWFRNV